MTHLPSVPTHRLSDEDTRRRYEALAKISRAEGFRERLDRAADETDRAILRATNERVKSHSAEFDAARAGRGPIAIPGFTIPAVPGWMVEIWRELARALAARAAAGAPARDPAQPDPRPVLHELSVTVVRPGDVINLFGEYLGNRVFMTLGTGIIELQILASETSASHESPPNTFRVEVLVPPELTKVLAHNGDIWVEGAVSQSNPLSIRFEPILEFWMMTFEDELKAWGAGAKKDAIALATQSTTDANHQVGVTLMHRHQGWSELRAPFAGGQSFAQGYHIGNAWSEYSKIRLFYQLVCARGFGPAPVPGATGWQGPSSIPHLPTW